MEVVPIDQWLHCSIDNFYVEWKFSISTTTNILKRLGWHQKQHLFLAKYIFHHHFLDPVDQTRINNNKKEEEDHDEYIQEDRIVNHLGGGPVVKT
jgi:hypothetical protein